MKKPESPGHQYSDQSLLKMMIIGVVWLFLLLSTVGGQDADQQTCQADGTCSAASSDSSGGTHPQEHEAGNGAGPPSMLGICDGSTDLYSHGGTAQAYKPGAPLSNHVCGSDVSKEFKYKVASWPFNRRSFRKGTAPTLEISFKLWSCPNSVEGNGDNEKCQCTSLADSVDGKMGSTSVVEVWQARPDGRYSTLRLLGRNHNDECRAQVPLSDAGEARFTTVSPGSTGSLGGLGPSGWEWSPYGPPVIHMLTKVTGHAPLLLDIPILFNPKTLEEKSFSMGDWRGASWVRSKPKQAPFQINSWTPDFKNNKISISIDIYVQKCSSVLDETNIDELCQSWLYGMPGSFFFEPICICGPSFLNFFEL